MKLYEITDGKGIGTRLLTAVIVQIKTAIIVEENRLVLEQLSFQKCHVNHY